MAPYKYKARDKEGRVYERSVEVENRYDIYRIIREEGGTVVSIREARSLASFVPTGFAVGGIKAQQKINFAKNLGLMMNAGLPVTRALSVMARQSASKPFKRLLADLEENVNRGQTLSDSLSKHSKVFSPLFISMVKAGEESGSVSEALALVAGQMEKSHLLAKKVRGALIYPGVIISVMIVISILLLMYMVPVLTETFEGIGAELPFSTRVLIAASDFLVENTIVVLGGLGLAISIVILFARSRMGHRLSNYVVVKLPIIGEMIREFQSAQTARTLSSLLSSGVEFVVALESTAGVLQNYLYKDVLARAKAQVEKGEPMSSVFIENSKLYPIFVGEMIAVGEETGKIAEMLMNVAAYYENEVEQKTKNLSTIIEPILMVIIGAGVGVFAISMLAPTYSLVDHI